MTKEEKVREQQWQAESDADTMARYNEIMADNMLFISLIHISSCIP